MNGTIQTAREEKPADAKAMRPFGQRIEEKDSLASIRQPGNVRFSLDQTDGAPVYRQIIRQIEYAVVSGRLKRGDRLPTIRSLAVDLKINPNTIAKAYGELEIRGILETQVGSGTYISGKKPPAEEEGPERMIRELVGRFIRDMEGLGVEKRELARVIASYKEDN